MLWLAKNGGWIIILLTLFSIIGGAIAIRKFFQLRNAIGEQSSFFKKMIGLLKNNQFKKAVQYCKQQSTPFSSALQEGLKQVGKPRDEIKSIVKDRADVEMQTYESGLGALGSIAHVSPLLGLLGTVIGMIIAFMNVEATTSAGASVQPTHLSKGIWQALLTTAAGLIVAIVLYLARSYLLSLRDRLFTEFEDQSLQTINILARFRRARSDEPPRRSSSETTSDHDARQTKKKSTQKNRARKEEAK